MVTGRRGGKMRFEIKPFYVLAVALLSLSILILHPFINVLLTAGIISYISYPLHRWIYKTMRKKAISALVTTSIIVLIISIPSTFAITALLNEIPGVYGEAFKIHNSLDQFLLTDTEQCGGNSVCEFLKGFVNDTGLTDSRFASLISDAIEQAIRNVIREAASYLASFPYLMAGVFISLFLTYYLLKDGSRMVSYARSILPIKTEDQTTLIRRFNEVTYAVVYGNVIVAIVQGMLTSIGFFIFGVPSPILWGIVTVFASLIPFLGTYVVWLPAAVFLMVQGYSSGNGLGFLLAVGLFFYGMLIISGVDNILKPKIIGGRANLHPALVLLGVIGGLSAFGLIGIIIGPVIIALATTTVQMMAHQRNV